ncbi:type VII secretion-associated protein [Rhodococcus sp. NPDC056743]|uniref:type VII secretion-associated protein n=1 Tax=Rhodococcus sp. NPDC056743 TaxID=3345934 RepID=UPI0036719C58
MDATAVTPGHTLSVSVHVGSLHAWSATGQREFCCRVDTEQHSSPAAALPIVNPFDFIDDNYMEIGGRIAPTDLELVHLIQHAVQGCGLADADVLYLSYPTEWGNTRKGRLLDAARQVGYDVVLVPTAIAIARATRSSWRARCVVVEIRGGDAVVSCARDFDGDVTIMSTRRRPLSELPQLFGELEELTVRDSVVVVGRHSHPIASSLERGSRSIHGYASVRVLDESRIVRAIVDPRVRLESVTAENSAGRAVDNSAFGDRWVLSSTPVTQDDSGVHPRRWWAALAALVVVVGLCGIGAAVVTGRVEGTAVHARPTDGRSADVAPVTMLPTTLGGAQQSTLVPSTTSAAPTTTIPLGGGNVSVEVPAGWAPDPNRSTAGRMDLIPPSGNDRKIVIMEKELRTGVEFDAVELDLRDQLAAIEDPLRFGKLESAVAVDGRKVLLYSEFPDGYSEVRWQVFVERGTQVSIGCQYIVGEWDALEPECIQIVESLSYVN